MHRIWLFRHAKSAWDTDAGSDFERPLAKRGRRDAPRMGAWLERHGVHPDEIWCSTAVRARETLELARGRWSVDDRRIRYLDALYGAPASELLALTRSAGEEITTLMLVGHNPGLEDLLETLCDEAQQRTAKGKLLTTANLAEIDLRGEWQDVDWDTGDLVRLLRPRALGDGGRHRG
ncbi:MAG: histidine phosphatase family protein [Xanthomonadales bacterium]|nr:histidine phosphatase family protein [Xanthomonadales bacterium]